MVSPRTYLKRKNEAGGLRSSVRLLVDIRGDIQRNRRALSDVLRSSLTNLYWRLGRRIQGALVREKSALGADRRDSMIATLAAALGRQFGRAYTQESLVRMLRFAQCYPTPKSLESLDGMMWSHVVALLALSTAQEREFYAKICRAQGLSPAQLRGKIKSLFYGRSTWSMKGLPAHPGSKGMASELPQDSLMGDPDLADFLGCDDGAPRDQRSAVIRSMEDYILGLDVSYCFVERFKRFQVGPDDYTLDLVLYHRGLKCHIALMLNFGDQRAQWKDLMDFYLTWLNLHERLPHENPPLGILLDTQVPGPQLSLRQLDDDSPRVAWYQTALPPRSVFHQFFMNAVASASENAGS